MANTVSNQRFIRNQERGRQTFGTNVNTQRCISSADFHRSADNGALLTASNCPFNDINRYISARDILAMRIHTCHRNRDFIIDIILSRGEDRGRRRRGEIILSSRLWYANFAPSFVARPFPPRIRLIYPFNVNVSIEFFIRNSTRVRRDRGKIAKKCEFVNFIFFNEEE